MRISIIFALVLSAFAGCNRNNQPTMHQARTQNTPTEQAAQAEELDTENPNNRTLPDSPDQNPNDQNPNDQLPPADPSGNPTNPTDDIDDDLPPNTGPDVP